MAHLSQEELIELAEGMRPESSAPHLSACDVCRRDLAELRSVLAAVAGVDVPEPSPLFWDHLSARISQAVVADAAGERSVEPWWAPVRRWRWGMAAAAGVTVLVVAATLSIRPGRSVVPASAGPAAGIPASDTVELADVSDDPSLGLLGDLAEDLDWDAAAEAGISPRAGTADRVAGELDEVERAALQRLLNDALGSSGGALAAGSVTRTL